MNANMFLYSDGTAERLLPKNVTKRVLFRTWQLSIQQNLPSRERNTSPPNYLERVPCNRLVPSVYHRVMSSSVRFLPLLWYLVEQEPHQWSVAGTKGLFGASDATKVVDIGFSFLEAFYVLASCRLRNVLRHLDSHAWSYRSREF